MREVRSENPRCRFLFIFANAVLVVANLGATSVPADILLGGHLLGVHEDLHSFVVETVRFA